MGFGMITTIMLRVTTVYGVQGHKNSSRSRHWRPHDRESTDLFEFMYTPTTIPNILKPQTGL